MVRTRVIQTLFAYYKDGDKTPLTAKKELLKSFSDTYDLYVLLLDFVNQLTMYAEEQIQQAVQEADVSYASASQESGFQWPLPCSSRVTSRYGNRSDPFTGETRYHSGIDIDGFGNDGAPVVAAASGEVITASYDSSYGNYVIIDHGGTSTVYAHMSGLAVSYGQTVSQGQTIGYVGATGRATGTHLHFEVYVGDGRVDPTQYFSNISYYNC